MNLHTRKYSIITSLESAFIYFILLQPLLDVLAYFGLPVSIIVRVGAMGVGLLYIILLPDRKMKRITLVYLGVLAVFMAAYLAINFMITDQFLMAQELTYVVKTVFFIEMMIVYLFVIRSYAIRENWQVNIQFYSFINMVFIALVMLSSTLTDSGKKSYGSLAKEGHSGWFYSGNELSIILGMGFSIVILYIVRQTSLAKKIILIPIVGLIIWAMLMVGTKVGLGSVFIVLGIGIFIFIFKTINDKKNIINALMLALFLTGTILVTPESPVGNNLNLTFGTELREKDRNEDISIPQAIEEQSEPKLLSGRKDFLNNMQGQYKDAPSIQKIVGMGYAGNYTKNPKLIEMDFWDWYYSFGIVGFILLVIPILYIGYRITIKLIRFHMKEMNTSVVFSGVAVCLGFGVATLAGHVLSSPATSIYLAIYIGYFHAVFQRAPLSANK